MWFEVFRGPIAGINGGFAAVGAYFAWVILQNGSPIAPELYGEEVYAIDAILWAGAQLGFASLAAAGAIMQGRLGAIMSLIGSALLIGLFSIFVTFASRQGQGTIVFAGTLFLCLPGAWFTLLAAWEGLRVGRR